MKNASRKCKRCKQEMHLRSASPTLQPGPVAGRQRLRLRRRRRQLHRACVGAGTWLRMPSRRGLQQRQPGQAPELLGFPRGTALARRRSQYAGDLWQNALCYERGLETHSTRCQLGGLGSVPPARLQPICSAFEQFLHRPKAAGSMKGGGIAAIASAAVAVALGVGVLIERWRQRYGGLAGVISFSSKLIAGLLGTAWAEPGLAPCAPGVIVCSQGAQKSQEGDRQPALPSRRRSACPRRRRRSLPLLLPHPIPCSEPRGGVRGGAPAGGRPPG